MLIGSHVNKLRPLQHVGSEPISMHAMHADVFWEYDPLKVVSYRLEPKAHPWPERRRLTHRS